MAARENGPDLVTMHLLEPQRLRRGFPPIRSSKWWERLGARRYSLVGAMYDMVPHTRPLLVSGDTLDAANEAEYRSAQARPSDLRRPHQRHPSHLSARPRRRPGPPAFLVVHLPQYFQVEEDFTGAARLTGILCRLYGLPSRLEGPGNGASSNTPRCKTSSTAPPKSPRCLSRLEERYDRENRQAASGAAPPYPPCPPQIEEFLQGLDFGARPDAPDADDDPDDDDFTISAR